MLVQKRLSSFNEVLRDLRGCGSLAIPVEVVPAFVDYCNTFAGVYPCGGALVQDSEGNMLQYLYL